MLNDPRERPGWAPIAAGSVCGLAVLVALGAWAVGVYSMSDPTTTTLVGLRVDGSRLSVKVPTCPSNRVGTVEVHDSDSEKLLWRASGPKTSKGKRGALVLWKADDFRKVSPGTQPKTLPAHLDVSVTFAGADDGTGGTFDIREAKAAHVPAGRYWTPDGPRTASQIDAQFTCHAGAVSLRGRAVWDQKPSRRVERTAGVWVSR